MSNIQKKSVQNDEKIDKTPFITVTYAIIITYNEYGGK